MGMPSKLKNMNLFHDGTSFLGQVSEVTLPKLSRKMEEWRGAGMNLPVDADFGMELMTMEWQCGGFMQSVLEQWGEASVSGVPLRFAGAFQRDDSGEVDAVEVVVRGRHKEIDMGSGKLGSDTEFKVTSTLSYYKLSVNGSVVVEIDALNFVETVNGVDRLEAQRRAIGI